MNSKSDDTAQDMPAALKRDENNQSGVTKTPKQGKPAASNGNGHDKEGGAPTPNAETPTKGPKKARGAVKKAAGGAPAKKAKARSAAPAKAAKAKAKPRGETIPLDVYGFREGSIKSKAAAMYASESGSTMGEVKKKLDSSQLNLLKDLESRGCKIVKKKEAGKKGQRMVTRYFLKGKPKS